ncbi:MAG: hypothetical protein LRS46_01670 [Desulfurococcales archaeon]|nr:hypothetical protein [Desulfurococcales archaeon]
MSAEGRILEALSRIMARLDGIERRIEEVNRALQHFASTVYIQCALERLGGKVLRSGLPSHIDGIILRNNKIYIIKSKILSSYNDAEELKRITPHIAALVLDEEEKEVIPVLVTSKYVGESAPEGVNIIIC